jgi:hypothetical protein
MDSNTKGIITVGVALGVVGLAYYFLVHNRTQESGSDSINFNSLLSNTGLKPNQSGILIIPFNDSKNSAQFYNNNRIFIFDADKNVVAKGTYSDGGKSIKLDSGSKIASGSVFSNLLKIVK